MADIHYRGAESINYKTGDLSDLEYIKIVYKDKYGAKQEVKTEINYLSDDYISLSAKKIVKRPENSEPQEEVQIEDVQQPIAEKSTSYLDYINKIKEEKEREEKEAKEKEQKELEEIKKLNQKFDVDCPQEILIKFVIDGLLYTAETTLNAVEIKSSKVYFKITAPETMYLQQRRKFYRIDLSRLCLIVATDNKNSSVAFSAKSINLSAGGVLIHNLESVQDDSTFRLEPKKYQSYNLILVLEMNMILKLSARFIRHEENETSNCYAFEFVDMSDEKTDMISKYVIRKQLDDIRVENEVKNKITKK